MRGMILTMTTIGTAAATPLAAQTCPPPAPLAAWAKPVVARPGASLAVGQATTLVLGAKTAWAIKPDRPQEPDATGTVAAFQVATAGTYRVALGAGAWIDVVRDGKALASTAHAHGEACSGIGKMVDFSLTPGRYVIQLSGAKTPAMTVLIARVP